MLAGMVTDVGAVMDFEQPWNDGFYAFTVLDVETSGLEPTDRVLEVAAVRFELLEKGWGGWQIAGSFSSIVNPAPGFVVPPESTEIHGIDQARVDAAPSFAEVWPHVLELCEGETVACAYNAAFDRPRLRTEAMRAELTKAPDGLRATWFDPLVWVKARDRFEKGPGRHKLVNVCKRWGVDLTDAHSALADATATGRIALSERMSETVLAGLFVKETPLLSGVLAAQVALAESQERDWKRFQDSLPSKSKCRSCDAPVLWKEAEGSGRKMPLNAEPDPFGTIALVGKDKCKVLDPETLQIVRAEPVNELYSSHFASCPNADKHRKVRA